MLARYRSLRICALLAPCQPPKFLRHLAAFIYVQDISSADASTVQEFRTTKAPLFVNDANVLFELYNEPANNENEELKKRWIFMNDTPEV